jgi:translation initiation factor 2A
MKTLEGGIVNADGFTWNSTGTLCGLINKSGGITVYDVIKNFAVSFEPPCSLKGIKAFYFSPLSTYLVAGERFEPKTPELPNMSLWHVAGKTKIVQGRIKKISGNSWPSMKWTDDEVCCCRVISAEDSPTPGTGESHILQVLNSKTSKTENIDIAGVTKVEVCPKRTVVSVFIAESEEKRRRPSVRVLDLSITEPEKRTILAHDFEFGIDTCAMRWNASGDRLLVQAGSEIDESGQSYYGTSRLYLFLLPSSNNPAKVVPIAHDPPVQDAQWNPQGDQFCLISGQTPFSIRMLDKAGSELHDFGKSKKNTIRFSSVKGRFLALGGFGNLAGELEFLDVPSKKTFKTTRSECTVECEWSPNGRVLMTSSTHPRMRVDNNITFFRYTGEKVSSLEFPELYSAKWRPMPHANFPDLPACPRALSLKQTEPEPVKKAYRPPSRNSAEEDNGSRVTPKRGQAPVVAAPPPPPAPPAAPIKMPCPEKDWFYRDPKGEVHGPYTKSVMNSWNKAGYFKPNLPIRAGTVLPFVELATLFPEGLAAFDQSMIIPAAWLSFRPPQ